jgi:hypothetical protein
MRTSFSDLLKWLGERRDGFLISGAVLYGLGYLVWSYNAWRNNLGQLPALEFQYVVAGIIPAAIIAIAWAGFAFFHTAGNKIMLLFERRGFGFVLLSAATFVLLVGGFFVILGTGNPWIHIDIKGQFTTKYLRRLCGLLVLVALYFAAASPIRRMIIKREGTPLPDSRVLRAIRASTDGAMKANLFLYRFIVPAVFCGGLLVTYFELYPALPQELGGPNPRCAYVDLVREDISPSTMVALVSAQPSEISDQSWAKVVRSDKLYVYFSSGDYLLVRLANTNNNSVKREELPLYQLQKEAIRVIRWCE